jgi:hypothetical protein
LSRTSVVTNMASNTRAPAKDRAKDRADALVRRRLADVIGKWWCRHGPLGKRLLGTLLCEAAVPDRRRQRDQPKLVGGDRNRASSLSAGGARVTVVCAGTGEVLVYGYALPSTGRAHAMIAALRSMEMVSVPSGHALRLFCGHDGPELRPDTCMETFTWPEDREKELVMMPYKLTGLLGALGCATQHTTVHAKTNTVATVMHRSDQVTTAQLRCGASTTLYRTFGDADRRHGLQVEALTFSHNGSVLVVTYTSRMARFFAVSSGKLLESIRYAPNALSSAECGPVAVVSAAKANHSGTALTAVDTLLCVPNSTVRFHGTPVVGVRFVGVVRGALGVRLVQGAGVLGRSTTAAIMHGPAHAFIGVCATVRTTAEHGTPETRVCLVSLQTGCVLRALRPEHGELRVMQSTGNSRSYWTVHVSKGKYRMRNILLCPGWTRKHIGTLTTAVTENAITTCVQLPAAPWRHSGIMVSAGGTVSLVQYDGERKVGEGWAAWPVSSPARAVVLKANGSLTVANM